MSARHVAQTAVGMNRLMNPFDPIDLSILRAIEEMQRVLVQTAKGIGDNGLWCIAKLNEIPFLPEVGSKTTSFSSVFAGIFASN